VPPIHRDPHVGSILLITSLMGAVMLPYSHHYSQDVQPQDISEAAPLSLASQDLASAAPRESYFEQNEAALGVLALEALTGAALILRRARD